jgi:hypothetical protein
VDKKRGEPGGRGKGALGWLAVWLASYLAEAHRRVKAGDRDGAGAARKRETQREHRLRSTTTRLMVVWRDTGEIDGGRSRARRGALRGGRQRQRQRRLGEGKKKEAVGRFRATWITESNGCKVLRKDADDKYSEAMRRDATLTRNDARCDTRRCDASEASSQNQV